MATLELIGLTKHFGGSAVSGNAVNDVNLSVGDGEFLCILGPSGCGKSTTLRMIGGFEEPTAGDVRIDGVSVVDMPPNRRPTAMVFQKYTLWPHMRVYDNIAFGLRLRHLPGAQIDREVHDSLQLVGLSGYERRYPAQLSGGEQQRVALARALVLQPKILLLDEPFSNLDALLRVRLREELHAIQRRVKITTIFVTHDQEEALSLADRIAVMSAGHLEQLDRPSQIYAYPKTLFVADFIGVMNIFPAERDGGWLRVGQYALRAPDNLDVEGALGQGALSVAVRPEDFTFGVSATPTSAAAPATASAANGSSVPANPLLTWQGTIDQSIDLGHYRKVLVVVPGLFGDEAAALAHRLKVYIPKSAEVKEGDRVALTPTRYLVYSGHAQPVEVRNLSERLSDENRRNDLSRSTVSVG
jgi:putative spermidine/putrescine transport system ATP-binding protein